MVQTQAGESVTLRLNKQFKCTQTIQVSQLHSDYTGNSNVHKQ